MGGPCICTAVLTVAMASAAEPQPTVDPPDEEFDLTKPYWVGYFRLPSEDVKCEKLFEPKYR